MMWKPVTISPCGVRSPVSGLQRVTRCWYKSYLAALPDLVGLGRQLAQWDHCAWICSNLSPCSINITFGLHHTETAAVGMNWFLDVYRCSCAVCNISRGSSLWALHNLTKLAINKMRPGLWRVMCRTNPAFLRLATGLSAPHNWHSLVKENNIHVISNSHSLSIMFALFWISPLYKARNEISGTFKSLPLTFVTFFCLMSVDLNFKPLVEDKCENSLLWM